MLRALKFQQVAVRELADSFLDLWRTGRRKLPLTFKSPTGSGKTFVMASFLRELNHLPNWDEDKAFVWITFSDDIAMQSRDKFRQYFGLALENELLTVNDINVGKLAKNGSSAIYVGRTVPIGSVTS